MTLVVFIDG